MSSEPLQPVSLDPSNSSQRPEGDGSSARRMVWVAVVLVAGGLSLIGWLANRGAPDTPPAVATPTGNAEPTATPDPALRREAEAMLEQVVKVMGQVRNTAPDRWAGEIWTQAEEANARGDQAMADQRWREAAEAYQSTVELLQPLVSSLPAVPARLLPLIPEEIAAGEKEEAVRLVQAVLAVASDHEEALALLPRAEVADQSFAAFQRAQEALALSQLDVAFVEVQTLRGLDPLFPGFSALEAEVEAQVTSRELGVLLGRITLALDEGDLETAEAALKEAMALDPEGAAVVDAARRVKGLRLERQILSLKQEAERSAAQEDWQAAHERWLEMKALDPDAPWIDKGLQMSLKWAVIDAKLRRGLLRPGSEQTREWVKEFATRDGWPDRLAARAQELEHLHRSWTTPVKVVLVSDGETEVTLRRVGRWREVIRKELALLPGDYVATGGRLGYRDVRVPFTVPPGSDPLQIEVICTEGI